jgi:hypothetical protein
MQNLQCTYALRHSSFGSRLLDMTNGYVPAQYGYWMPPHLNMGTPASTIIPTPVTTPIIPTMSMPSCVPQQSTGVMGTPAWLPGTVNSTFVPVNATYGIPVSAVPTNPATTFVPPNPATTFVPTTPQVPMMNASATSTPQSLVIPLQGMESDDEEEPPKVIMVEKRRRRSSNAQTVTRIPCCGSCLTACNCSYEDTVSTTVIHCACQPAAPAPAPAPTPSHHVSWESYYPDRIYDFHHRPVPAPATPPKEKEKERHLFFLHRVRCFNP